MSTNFLSSIKIIRYIVLWYDKCCVFRWWCYENISFIVTYDNRTLILISMVAICFISLLILSFYSNYFIYKGLWLFWLNIVGWTILYYVLKNHIKVTKNRSWTKMQLTFLSHIKLLVPKVKFLIIDICI